MLKCFFIINNYWLWIWRLTTVRKKISKLTIFVAFWVLRVAEHRQTGKNDKNTSSFETSRLNKSRQGSKRFGWTGPIAWAWPAVKIDYQILSKKSIKRDPIAADWLLDGLNDEKWCKPLCDTTFGRNFCPSSPMDNGQLKKLKFCKVIQKNWNFVFFLMKPYLVREK